MPIEPIKRTETTAFKEREKTINKVNEIIDVINEMPEPIEYVQGEHINITDNVISQVDLPEPIEYIQGEHIDITDNVISQIDIPQELIFSDQFYKIGYEINLSGNRIFDRAFGNPSDFTDYLVNLDVYKQVFVKMEGTYTTTTTNNFTFEGLLIKTDTNKFNCSNVMIIKTPSTYQDHVVAMEIIEPSMNHYKFTVIPSSGIGYNEFVIESINQHIIGWFDE